MKKKFMCTFPPDLIQEPILYNVGKNFSVVPNIRAASVTDEIAILGLELEGEEGEIERATSYLREKGVKVEEVIAGS
jgi:ABC-type methionine transport system ATPase subunit